MAIRWMFSYQRQQAEGEWRKCHSEELRNFQSSENIIRLFSYREMDSAGHVTQYETREVHKEIVMYERKTPLGRKRRGRKHNTNCTIYKKMILNFEVDSSGQNINQSMFWCERLRNLGLCWYKVKQIYFRCYAVHVVELLNYYTNYCTYIYNL